MPTLARITLYPFKSLDGQDAERAKVLPSGALEHDRRFALVDAEGRFVNAKRTDKLHPIRSAFDPARQRWKLLHGEELTTFDLGEDREEIEQYFSLLIHQRVRLVENATHGFPDDTNAPGPTVISTATLQTVAEWFPGLDLDEVRRRFRANLEIEGVEPFWEDRLFGEGTATKRFRIGSVELEGVNPCARCVVPSREAHTGDVWPGFSKTFVERRKQMLPSWAPISRFDHYYRLAVNTRLAGSGGEIAVGDEVILC
jgi:uncharacterized protein YcbX